MPRRVLYLMLLSILSCQLTHTDRLGRAMQTLGLCEVQLWACIPTEIPEHKCLSRVSFDCASAGFSYHMLYSLTDPGAVLVLRPWAADVLEEQYLARLWFEDVACGQYLRLAPVDVLIRGVGGTGRAVCDSEQQCVLQAEGGWLISAAVLWLSELDKRSELVAISAAWPPSLLCLEGTIVSEQGTGFGG
ncbi:hypothetical protein MHYP_G00024640 [Metynnis hypsauchen]